MPPHCTIAQALQQTVALSKVSAQASQAGLSIEYTTALLAKGIETTQEAPESIGTALKTIIARFRELSDYGSTLEDGVNVNQVEEALSAQPPPLKVAVCIPAPSSMTNSA